MADLTLDIIGRSQRVSCVGNETKMFILFADIKEGMSRLTETTIEFLSDKSDLDGHDFLEKEFKVELDLEEGGSDTRDWFGTCVEFILLGESTGQGHGTYGHYRVQLRSWPWMLTRTTDCRIFQELTTEEIIKSAFGDAGYSDYKFILNKSPKTRPYCVQYRETDFDFVTRLMEEEGMFYYFDHSKDKQEMVIRDDSAALEMMKGDYEIKHQDLESGQRESIDFIHKWEEKKRFDTGSVTMLDYDFTKSRTEVKGSRRSSNKPSKYEQFDYPGKFLDSEIGSDVTRLRIGAIETGTHRVVGEGLVKHMASGFKFELKEHPVEKQNKEYLAINVFHHLRMERTDEKGRVVPADRPLDQDGITEAHAVVFEAQLSDAVYVPPLTVDWPAIPGIQTAVVVGPKGEEIYTDEHGRVKVQFHWDRLGKKDDKSSCFIRVVTPMSGKTWGAFHIPRIEQEVVVQFEEGNPDRPIITGMLYNDFNPTPVTFPDNKTQLGMRSDVHKNDDKKAFHEFIFEDEKDKEFIHLVSEKDYDVKIKNNTIINYGTGDKDEGTLVRNVWKQTTETFGTGSKEGGLDQKIQDDFKKQVVKGDYILDVDTGKRTTNIKKDDILNTDKNLKITAQKNIEETAMKEIKLTATTKITLKCGGSTITMTPASIEIKSTKIDVKASAAAVVKGIKVDVDASAALTLKGGVVMIN